MKRRDLLKTLAAAPFLPLAANMTPIHRIHPNELIDFARNNLFEPIEGLDQRLANAFPGHKTKVVFVADKRFELSKPTQIRLTVDDLTIIMQADEQRKLQLIWSKK